MRPSELRKKERLASLLDRIESLSHSQAPDKLEPVSFYQGLAMLFAESLLSTQTGESVTPSVPRRII